MSSKNSKSSAKPRKLKSKRGYGKNVTKTKVVVRRLPPLIPESLFFESVKQWVNEETCTWSRFHQGRISKSKNKESIFSRAYFHFKTVEQVLEFHRGYDNHLFIDKQGNENRAVVEFAVYQKLPKEHKKPDPRQGTIETDPDYLAFLESLKMEEIQQATAKEPGVVLESGATQLERLEARLANAAINAASVEKPTTTPLLEHLRALKLGPKSKPPPLKHAHVAILSPSGLSTKGTGSRAAKQSSQQTRATQANEFPQSTNRHKRERKRRERGGERRDKREKDKEKDKKDEEENNKDIVKAKEKESEVVDEKLKEKTKEQVREKENYRDKRRDKKQERHKLMREREKKAQATEANKSELPTITIVPRPQTEESKVEAKEKEKDKEKEKETKRAPVKITIQQRQKEQIRQFIQKTSPSPKKEINTAENDSKETAYQESFAKDSTVTVQKDTRKEENKDTSEASVTSSSSNVSSNYRRRDRSRKHSTDTKTPVQIQILTKPQTQSTNTSESNISTSTSSAAVSSSGSAATTNTPSPIRRRGYYGKRGGRW